MKRVTSEIIPWYGRFKAMIFVDGHKVQQTTFNTEEEAEVWCDAEMDKLAEVVRE